MATPAQIDANRRNAQKSTGPRTPEGKANSCRNALKLGLSATALMISGEDPREMAEMAHDYYRLCPPTNAFQRFHLENIIYCDWMIRRCRRIEAELINHFMAKDRSVPFEVEAGCAYERDAAGPNALYKLHRRMNSLEKSYYRSMRELEASGARFDGAGSGSDSGPDFELDPAPGPEHPSQMPEAAAAAPPDSAPEIGFVLADSETVSGAGKTSQSPMSPSARNPTLKRDADQVRSAG